MIFNYAQKYGKTFGEIFDKEPFINLMTDKVMSKDLSEYDERFNHIWGEVTKDLKK